MKAARLTTVIMSLDDLTPNTVYAPTSWEVIRALQHAPYLEVAEPGRYRRLTKYRLRCSNSRDDYND